MRILKYLSLFAWLLIPLGIWQGAQTFGTPHLVVSYSFYNNGAVHNPHAHRRYIDCTYWGWTGLHRVPARHARCPWVRLLRSGP